MVIYQRLRWQINHVCPLAARTCDLEDADLGYAVNGVLPSEDAVQVFVNEPTSRGLIRPCERAFTSSRGDAEH